MMEAAKSSEILTHFQQTTWYTSHTTVIVKRHKLEMENKRYYITAHSVCSMNGGGGLRARLWVCTGGCMAVNLCP